MKKNMYIILKIVTVCALCLCDLLMATQQPEQCDFDLSNESYIFNQCHSHPTANSIDALHCTKEVLKKSALQESTVIVVRSDENPVRSTNSTLKDSMDLSTYEEISIFINPSTSNEKTSVQAEENNITRRSSRNRVKTPKYDEYEYDDEETNRILKRLKYTSDQSREITPDSDGSTAHTPFLPQIMDYGSTYSSSVEEQSTSSQNIQHNSTFVKKMNECAKITRNNVYRIEIIPIKSATLETNIAPNNEDVSVNTSPLDIIRRDIAKAYLESNSIWTVISSFNWSNVYTVIDEFYNAIVNSDEIPESCKNNFKKLYYVEFFVELRKYLEKNEPATYGSLCRDKNIDECTKKTLGDVYISKDFSMGIYLNCLSILNTNTPEYVENRMLKWEDEELTEALHIIIGIPEVYEDLTRLSSKDIDDLQEKYDSGNKNMKDTLFCIIRYLIGKVTNNRSLMSKQFDYIKNHVIKGNTEYTGTINIFNMVYSKLKIFYEIASSIYTESSTKRKNPHHKSNAAKDSLKTSKCMLKGKSIFDHQKYKRCNTNIYKYPLQKTIPYKSLPFNLKQQSAEYTDNIASQMGFEVQYANHYHVQFVNNTRHTVKMIHLPYYVEKDEFGTLNNYCFHTVADIIDHIKNIYSIETPEDNPSKNNVHAFKYHRETKAWTLAKKSLFSNKDDMSKTVNELLWLGYDVVFYHIEEDISATNLFCIEIDTIASAENSSKPRIPIFFTKFMLTAIETTPYLKRSKKDICRPIEKNKAINAIRYEYMDELDQEFKYPSRENYYSDFYLHSAFDCYKDPYCYNMNVRQENNNSDRCDISWNVFSNDTYNQYITMNFTSAPNNDYQPNKESQEKAIEDLLELLQSSKSGNDAMQCGIGVFGSFQVRKHLFSAVMSNNLRNLFMIEKPESKKTNASLNYYIEHRSKIAKISEYSNPFCLLMFKTVKPAMSQLGLHYEIMNGPFSAYCKSQI
ncbi:hypothetical protein NEAUS03_1311 [Nematocida ausubeli]|nr:hypothetical protein NEAUS03_1311 [Nematocida ausubeli]